MLTSFHNPDILTCLANLSSDEVFTPPNIANKMLDTLPEEIWSDKTVTFLDPVSKSGVFLREITKRLMQGLESEIPTLEDRLEHIDIPITVSIIGCVVNGPGEARETDIGLTGGGKGTHQIYLSGLADHRLSNGDIVEHVVDLVEARVAELKAADAASTQ